MFRFAMAALLSLSALRAAGGVSAPGDSLRQLRFSPDGRYILAQDSSEITVLTVQPLAVLFRIPAENASDAHFTPDSNQVVFVSSLFRRDSRPIGDPHRALRVRANPRVERWTVANGTRGDSPELRGPACGTLELSPDGRTLACDDLEGTLRVVDVASGETLFEKKGFVTLVELYHADTDGIAISTGQFVGDLGQARMDFSPDGHFLVARPFGGHGQAVAWDLHDRHIVNLNGRLRANWQNYCVFIAPHRMLISPFGVHPKHGVTTADLVEFPSTKILAKFKVPDNRLFRATDPDFVLVSPFGRGAWRNPNAKRSAAAELGTGQVIISDTPVLDVLGRDYVAEPSPGSVGLYERDRGLQATVALHGN
jgi:hypothetical protein